MERSNMPFESSHPLEGFNPEEVISSVVSSSDAIRNETIREIISKSGSDCNVCPTKVPRPLHRIAHVREEQNISLTRAAKQLGIDITEARRQENANCDMTLSQLYRWRNVLEVPVGELVVEPDEIPSNPVKNRSQLVKMMKTIRSILEVSQEESVLIFAEQLVDQMLSLMPELKSISAWPSIGQAREQRDPGQAALRRFDSNVSRRMEE